MNVVSNTNRGLAMKTGIALLASLAASSGAYAQSLYVSNDYTGTVRQYSTTGTLLSTFYSPGAGNKGVDGLRLLADGTIGIEDFGAGSLKSYDATSAALVTTYFTGDGHRPTDFLVDSANNFLYVADENNNSVVKYDLTTHALIRTYATGVGGAAGLAFRGNGDLLVADAPDNLIIDLNPTTGATGTFATGTFNGPSSIAVGSDGRFYISGGQAGVKVVGAAGGAAANYYNSSDAFGKCQFDPSGNLWCGVLINLSNQTQGKVVEIGGPGLDTQGLLLNSFATAQGTSNVVFVPNATVPEPGAIALLAGVVATGTACFARRRKSAK